LAPDGGIVGTGKADSPEPALVASRYSLANERRALMANDKSSHQAGQGPSQHARQGDSSAKGEKGVSQDQVGSGKEHDPNNFANNPDRAAAAGRKGGQHSHDRD
jgi:general stress protein YciG